MSDSSPTTSPKWLKPVIAVAGVLGIVVAGIVITTMLNRGAADEKISVKVMPVSVYTVKKEVSMDRVRRFTGIVKTERATDISFENMGTLVEVHVREGDEVKKNDVLAELDDALLKAQQEQLKAQLEIETQRWNELEKGPRDETIAAAKATVKSLDHQYQQALKDVDRRESLHKSGAISIEEWDRTLANRDTLKANLENAQKQLDELNAGTRDEQKAAQKAAVDKVKANLKDVEIRIKKSKIRAKFSGRIAARYLDQGAIVNAGVPVLRLVETGKLEAWVGIPPAVFARMKTSGTHKLLIAGDQYDATFAYVLPEIDEATRTRQVVFSINANYRLIAPGQVVRFTARTTESADGGIWIPKGSMTPAARGLFTVYVAEQRDGEWVVGKREVSVKSTDGEFVLVTGTLKEGDRVIAKGAHRITTGQFISPSEINVEIPTSNESNRQLAGDL